MSFVHLRLHTEYSLTDGLIRIDPPKRKGGGQGATLTSRAKDLKLPALAVTDRSNLFAALKFYKAAESAGIKPIIGADVLIAGVGKDDLPERLTLLVQDDGGYRNLAALLTRAYQQGQNRHGAVIQRDWLAERSEGLIALTGQDGALARALLAEQLEVADALCAFWWGLFPQRLYLEVTRCQRPDEESWITLARTYGRARRLPLVATNDVRFLQRKDFETHEARLCIAGGYTLSDPKRPRHTTEEQYLKSAEEMLALFHDLPDAIENTLHIARRCTLGFKFGTYHLPNFPVPEGETPDSFIEHEAREGLKRRFGEITLARPEAEYWSRLEFELGVIRKMGFAGYFLTVSDFIRWAKQNGCPVGPGRGSGAGSLVAYALRITDLDPLPYDLLFERFLNPERVSMPDFDVDFCMDNRDRVIDYVTQKYGRPYVGQIVTYNTMAAKGAVRDVTRIMGHGFGFGDRIAKLIPNTPGATLADALDSIPELKKAHAEEEDVTAVLDLALELEGITRGVGVHAGGVVIAPQPLETYTPLYCDDDGSAVRTQFDMKDLEAIGLVKFDFLGLKTLTVIEEAVQTIARAHGRQIDMLALPLTDTATYKLYASGKTGAVFQMESPGMQKASMDLKPDCFEDIIALVSLYRPGPMDNIPEFCKRKRGEVKIEYQHPDMEPVLKPTYGIFVYQEQVMQMSQRLAGYSLGGADLLRRAMGKKIKAEMEKQRAIFMEGALARAVPEKAATEVFDLMAKFADYGFNKSHAAAYALVSYHTAWLKTHYPAEFMAAVMSCEMAHPESVVAMREEALRMGLKVLPPSINHSRYRFTVPGKGQVRYGLGGVKGVGQGAVESLLAERDRNGTFADLFDFCRRIDLRKANKKLLEALIFSGSLDEFGLNRASLLKTLPKALQLAERAASNASAGQNDLFGAGSAGQTSGDAPRHEPELVKEWPLDEKLRHEEETLGFYLSGHPIESHRDLIEQVCSGRLPDIIAKLPPAPLPDANGKTPWQPRAKHLFAAWVSDVRYFKAREGAMGKAARDSYKLTLADSGTSVTVFIDAQEWDRLKSTVKVDDVTFVQADLVMSPTRDGRPSEPRLYNPVFFTRAALAAEYLQRLSLVWEKPASEVAVLRQLLLPFRHAEGVPVQVLVGNAMARAWLDLPVDWKLRLTEGGLAALQQFLNTDCVKVQYRRYVPPVTERRFSKGFSGAFSGGGDDE
jgi:DNA polymerase III subunit alpha